jgi:hypothetical protein
MPKLRRSAITVAVAALALTTIATTVPAAAMVFVEASRTGRLVPYADAGTVESVHVAGDELYVGGDDVIKVFARDARGTATPLRVITGPNTQLTYTADLTVGTDGRLYVVDWDGSVLIFADGANGDVAPVQQFENDPGEETFSSAIALDPAGDIHVADYDGRINVYPRTANGSVAPIRSLSGHATGISQPQDLLFGRDGELYVSHVSQDIKVFAAGAQGDIAPIREFGLAGDDAPVGFQYLANDSSGHVYGRTTDGILVAFRAGASGDVGPDGAVKATGIDEPGQITIDEDRNLYLGNEITQTVDVFNPIVRFTAPSPARAVTVSGARKDVARTISWQPPVDDGGRPVSYLVQITGQSLTLTKTTTSTMLTVGREDLQWGWHTVRVSAKNRVGYAWTTEARFKVVRIAPGAVRNVRVTGKLGAEQRTVRWGKVTWDGGAEVRRYRVVISKGRKVLVNERVKAGKKRALAVAKSDLGRGKHRVVVRAENKRGYGAPGTKAFRVTK